MVAIMAVVAVGAVVMLSRGDGGGGSTASPEEAARAFVEAARTQDCEALLGLLSQQSLSNLGASREEQLIACQATSIVPNEITVTNVVVTSQDRDTATVSVTSDGPDGTMTDDLGLVNEGGAWKVDPGDDTATGTPTTVGTVEASPPPGP